MSQEARRLVAQVAKEKKAIESPAALVNQHDEPTSSSRLVEMRQTVRRLRQQREKLRATCQVGSSSREKENYTKDRNHTYRLQQKLFNASTSSAAVPSLQGTSSSDAMKSQKFELRRQYLESKTSSIFQTQGTSPPLSYHQPPPQQQQQDDKHPLHDSSNRSILYSQQEEKGEEGGADPVSTIAHQRSRPRSFHVKGAPNSVKVSAVVDIENEDEKGDKAKNRPLFLEEEEGANHNKALPVVEIMAAYSQKHLEREQGSNGDESSPHVVQAMANWSRKWLKQQDKDGKTNKALPNRAQKVKAKRSCWWACGGARKRDN